ncbi:hypothetical protein U5922_002495 [Aquicoccus sp. G2-2]|uniref:hypothetical protein n=1 Tax=Aquicoccus sp. G2-2 TaxID=3092120 RepID=UPI002ADF693B|nr:hypothetical protein [Aquicoccus sp. G2-2]MEA1112391.1 hypothetical protein [Aquicoccus sp. G2-2]
MRAANHTVPRRLIIHLGVQKTGSTALHHFLQSNHAALAGRLDVMTPVKGSAMRELGRLAARFSLSASEEPAFLAAIDTVRTALAQGQGTCLLSHENLPGAMPGRGGVTALFPQLEAIIARLEARLAPHRPEYALYTRAMPAWKRSVHNQAVRSDNYTGTLPEFLAETAAVTDWQPLAARLDAAAPGRAHIFRLEDEPDSTRPGQQLLRLAGLSADEIATLAPLSGKRNPSLNSGALEFMRLLNGLDLARPARRAVADLIHQNPALFTTHCPAR